MRSMSPHRAVRHTLGTLLLLAGVAAGAGGAYAAAEPDFLYMGTNDQVQGLTSPRGCVAAKGGGGRGVTNKTRGRVSLYGKPGCAGTPVEVLRPGAVTQVRPYFASAGFEITR